MAVETEGLSSPVYSAEFVGNNFVEQYFKVLQMDPDLIYKFYEESSMLSWPDPEGVMSAVTTTQAIKDKISSLDYKGCKVEITTVDSQYSQDEGVMVLVAGCLTARDSVKRNFVQAFFLARHAKGYYVLNDIFRFVDVFEASTLSAVIDANENLPPAPLTPDQVSNHIPTHPCSTTAVSKGSKVRDSSDMNNSSDSNDLVGKRAVVSGKLTLNQGNGPIVIESPSNVQKDSQKMSYASVVKESTTPPVLLSTHNVVTVAPSSTHQEKQAPPAPRKPSAAFCTNSGPRNTTAHTEGRGVYIGNLPFEVTVEQLDDIFKKFGPIEREGIQIRNCKDGFSYGFVEFESSDSARSAIEAHNIKVGSNEVYIRERRYFNQEGNDGGRLSSGKSELRNANFRGRENSVEGRNYRPYQHGNRGEASHKARSPARENRWR